MAYNADVPLRNYSLTQSVHEFIAMTMSASACTCSMCGFMFLMLHFCCQLNSVTS